MAEIYGTTESYLESMQTTSLYEHNSLKSNEINRLVESIGVGKNYIASNFDLSFVVSNDASPILYAVLTPGIVVQDYTVINFQDKFNALKTTKTYEKTINIEIERSNVTYHNYSTFIGCDYHHGTFGDGINAKATYATIRNLQWLGTSNKFGDNYKYFVPFYKLTFASGHNGVNDSSSIDVERVIPHLKYDGVGQPIEQYKTSPEKFSVYGGDINEDDDAGLLWAVIL